VSRSIRADYWHRSIGDNRTYKFDTRRGTFKEKKRLKCFPNSVGL
jgi:hypothetical protein